MKKRYYAIALCLAAAAIAAGLFGPRLLWQLEVHRQEQEKQLASASVSLNAVQISLAARYQDVNTYTEEIFLQAGHTLTEVDAQERATTFLQQAFGASEVYDASVEPVVTIYDEQLLCGWHYNAELKVQQWTFTTNCYLDDTTGAVLSFFLLGDDDGTSALLENAMADGSDHGLGQLCAALQKSAGGGRFAVESTQALPEDIDPNFGAPIAILRYTGDDGESALLPINFSGSALFFNS